MSALTGTRYATLFGLGFLLLSSAASAERPFSPHGYQEVWECDVESYGFDWGSSSMYSTSYVYFRSRDLPGGSTDRWWTYASPGNVSSLDCGQWVNGWLAGGGTWPGQGPSLPQGVDVVVQTFHDDPWMDYSDSGECFHTHLTEYVWAWFWGGSEWMVYWYDSFQLQGEMQDGWCNYIGEELGDPPGYLVWGDSDNDAGIRINNSPFLVLWSMSQASSHFAHGCGEFQCYHPFFVHAAYL